MMHPHISASFMKIFLKILHNESGQGVKQSYINGFAEQIHVLVNGPFWSQN